MWMIVAHSLHPDAVVWRGRSQLAVLDALLWPLLVVWAAVTLLSASGVMLAVVLPVGVLSAARRLRCAIWLNHRYRFTTWWVLRLCTVLWAVGLAAKLVLP